MADRAVAQELCFLQSQTLQLLEVATDEGGACKDECMSRQQGCRKDDEHAQFYGTREFTLEHGVLGIAVRQHYTCK